MHDDFFAINCQLLGRFCQLLPTPFILASGVHYFESYSILLLVFVLFFAAVTLGRKKLHG